MTDLIMNHFITAHYFTLPTQGNIYSTVTLPLTSGKNKTLVATLKRKVFCSEFVVESKSIIPVIKEVPFTYIPSGAEIISIDAFNRSQSYDDFFVGITIIKVNGDQSTETYLNIYTEQDVDDKSELNLDSLAQNCLMLELSFIPYQLYHTVFIDLEKSSEAKDDFTSRSLPFSVNSLSSFSKSYMHLGSLMQKKKEIVWLLAGSDLKMHLFREDPLNHTYCEIEAEGLFPEFSRLPSIVLWVDIKHTSDMQRRLTAFGCECGTVKFYFVNILSNTILINLSKHFDAPISRVQLFQMKKGASALKTKYFGPFPRDHKGSSNMFNLLVLNTLQASVVFMDITKEELSPILILPESDKYDTSLCGCIADINMDGKMEILIGTFSKVLLIYYYEDNIWKLQPTYKCSHSIHSISYVDLTGDGIKELLVVTMLGINIFQHNLQAVMDKFKERLKLIKSGFRLTENQ